MALATSSSVVDGVTYVVNQEMVRRAKPQSSFLKMLGGALAIGLGLPAFALFSPIWYLLMLNKAISQRLSSVFLPIIMPMMDKGFKDIKLELLKNLHGRVLDVGCGAGDWLKYFGKATHVTELEPNPFLIPQIQRNADLFNAENPNVEVRIVNKFVHELDTNEPFDYIVFGNVMCEVPDQVTFLQEIDRVLKPGGKIIFQEHIRRDESLVGSFQDIFNHWWRVASDGCNCNRRTVEALKSIPDWTVINWDLDQDAPPFLDRMTVGIIVKGSQLAKM